MKIIGAIGGLLLVLSGIGNTVVFMYYEWQLLRESLLNFILPIMQFKVIFAWLADSTTWFFLGAAVVGAILVRLGSPQETKPASGS